MRCTATTKTGQQCKRVGYNWPQLATSPVLCAAHAFTALAAGAGGTETLVKNLGKYGEVWE